MGLNANIDGVQIDIRDPKKDAERDRCTRILINDLGLTQRECVRALAPTIGQPLESWEGIVRSAAARILDDRPGEVSTGVASTPVRDPLLVRSIRWLRTRLARLEAATRPLESVGTSKVSEAQPTAESSIN